MWHVVIGPCQHDDVTTLHLYRWHLICTVWKVACHVTVQTTMWHDLIGPWIGMKMPNLGDMWLLWCYHVIMLTSACHVSPSCSYHMLCMNVDVIRTDDDVNSTDVDSSLLIRLG
jgi:hypothetical protein